MIPGINMGKEIPLEDLESVCNTSLESTGIDLCGFTTDDVWQRAMEYVKEKLL